MFEKKEKKLIRTRFAAVPSAVGAVLVISAVAFGGSVLRPLAEQAGTGHGPSDKPAEVVVEKNKPTAQPDVKKEHDQLADPALKHRDHEKPVKDQPSQEPKPETQPEQVKPEPTPKPEPKPVAKPAPKPTEKPAPKPVSDKLEIWTGDHDGKTKVAWSAFEGDGFSYYKVVRSSDAEATWPMGAGDELMAAIGDRWTTKAFDHGAPCNTEAFYRVFAVKATDAGYQVLASSAVSGAVHECVDEPKPEPEPVEPYAMWLTAEQGEGGVVLHWEACGTDAFAAYKVVRSTTNDNPTYPLNDGTELMAAIGDANVTTFTDENVEAGGTYFYRVLSMGNDGSWYVLGKTGVVTVTAS